MNYFVRLDTLVHRLALVACIMCPGHHFPGEGPTFITDFAQDTRLDLITKQSFMPELFVLLGRSG